MTIILLFMVWRIWTVVFVLLGAHLIPSSLNFLAGGVEINLNNPVLWSWANFDGEHYLSIAQNGYGNFEQAFFPLYPRLINFLARGSDNVIYNLISGLAISNISILGALFVFYKLIRIDFDEKIAKWAIIFLLVFPVSFVFGGVYTESMFFLLVVSSFYFARKGNWWLAGFFGALASATRLMGIFLLPALIVEWFNQHNEIKQIIKNPRKAISLLPVLLTSTGLVWYMNFLNERFHDPLMFIHSQPAFGAQRVVDRFILLYQVFWRYLKMILATKGDPLFFTVWLELLSAIVFIVLIILAVKRGIRYSYIVFAGLSFLIPTLTGTFSSMPRYVLVLFPCFIVLALVKNTRFKYLWILTNIILLAISTIFFSRGYFIS